MTPSDEHTDISVTRARQGRWGRPVFWVLTVSTSLAVVAMIGAWVVQSNNLSAVQDSEHPSAAVVAHYAGPAPTPTRSPAPTPG
jgi:hypothetical protein